MKRTFLDTVWYQCLVLITQFRKGAWQEIDLNQAHHTCELKSISFWTIVLVKRKLNIFHTVIYWFWEEWKSWAILPQKFCEIMCSNQSLRKKFYLLIPATRFTLLDWRKCHNNVKPFVEYSKKETFDTEKKTGYDMITVMYLKANTAKYAADI